MQNLSEIIAKKTETLPLEKQREVLEFVENIAQEQPRKTIWEKIEERVKTLSPEDIERMPTDGAEQHDHYLYGTPKR